MKFWVYSLACLLCFGLSFSRSAETRICKLGLQAKMKFYNPRDKVCCGGRLTTRVGNQGCCGTTIIEADKQICCGGTVDERFVNGRERECCRSEAVFKDESSICCFDGPVILTARQKANRHRLRCCGRGVLADTRTGLCCDGRVVSRRVASGCCSGEPFHFRTHQCRRVKGQQIKLHVNERICGGVVYNRTEKSCCYGKLNDNVPEIISGSRNPKFGCCEAMLMDPTKEKCCQAELYGFETHAIPKDDLYRCCGSGFYNVSCQVCLRGQVLPKRPEEEICGPRLINTMEEGCCTSDRPFNKSSQSCCQGMFSSVIQADQACCNGAGVGENQLCCGNTKPCDKTSQEDDDCCFDFHTLQGQTFKRGVQQCDYGRLVQMNTSRSICGNQPYDNSTHLCCRGVHESELASTSSGINQCCGSQPYNSKTQACCYGKLFDIPSEEALCCPIDKQAYRYHDRSSACTIQCPQSTAYYNRINETCCEGVVHLYNKDAACCGPFYPNSTEKGCCAGRFPYPLRQKSRKAFDCCDGRELFSRKTSVCRKREVRTKSKWRNRLDTQAVCHHKQWQSVDGVVKHACKSQYALKGMLHSYNISSTAQTKTVTVSMTLKRVAALRIGPNFDRWTGPKTLKFRIRMPRDRLTKCKKALSKNIRRVAVFFSAKITGRKVAVDSHESFRIVRKKVVRKLRLTREFCEATYPDVLRASGKHSSSRLIRGS